MSLKSTDLTQAASWDSKLVNGIFKCGKIYSLNIYFRSTTNFKIKTVRRANQKRSCPYGAPPSSRACDTNCKSSPNSQLRKWNHQRRRYPSTCIPPSGTSAGSGNCHYILLS